MKTTVMLVDDEVSFVETLTKRLSRRGFKIVSAFSGSTALDKLREAGDEVDVIILDVKMPEMDGLETLLEIKRTHPLIEVILLTGHATVETGMQGMKLGAFYYLMKPCDIDVLANKINEAKTRKDQNQERTRGS